VTFRQSKKGRPRPGKGYRVDAVNAQTGTVRLVPDKGRAHDWQPTHWGPDQAEAFTQVEHEFRAGDRLRFTRNNYRAGRLDGHTAEVVATDPDEGILVVRSRNGKRQALDMANVADCHIEGRSSAKVGAIDETLMQKGAAITIPAPVRAMGVAIAGY
jgi:hypothetical protein